MSWLSENYDKAALGAAAVVALAVGYSIFTGEKEVKEPKSAIPNNTVEIEQRKTLALARAKYAAEYDFVPKPVNGNEVQSYVSFPLYSIKGKPDIVPLTNDYEIHPGMKLGWWKEYDLLDYKLKDGPELDADKDGFTNREEFDGKTDPTDSASHPNYIAKLKATAAKPENYELSWTEVDGVQGNFSFKNNRDRVFYGARDVGGKFPESTKKEKHKPLIGRFEVMERAVDPAIPGEKGRYFLLKDNGANKKDNTFKLYYSTKRKFQDWTATLSLDIEGEDTPFDVEEGKSFSLPFDAEADVKPYTFKSKKGEKAEIEYEVDGQKMTIELDIPTVR